MATVKRYDKEKGEWISVSTDQADSVFTNNSLLVNDDSSENKCVSVEDVLLNHEADIRLLKKNVSWLALHGGGGYGGGGSDSTVINTAQVVIIGPTGKEGVTELVWSGVNYIQFKIKSRGTSKYSVSVKVGINTVLRLGAIEKNSVYTISASQLGIKENTTLRIYAYDEDNNEYSATCAIIVPNISLIPEGNKDILISKNDFDTSNIDVTLWYKITLPGNYLLLYDNKQIIQSESYLSELHNSGNYIDLGTISNTNLTSVTVSLKSLNNIVQSNLGIYPVQFIIVHAENGTIFSDVVGISVSIVESTTLAVIPLIGLTQDVPFQTVRDAALTLKFKTYSAIDIGTVSWTVKMFMPDFPDISVLVSEGDSFIGSEVSSTISLSIYIPKLLQLLNNSELEDSTKDINLVFRVTATNGSKTASAFIYITALGTETERLEKYLEVPVSPSVLSTYRDYQIFDYTVDDPKSEMITFSSETNSDVVYSQDIPLLYKIRGIEERKYTKFSIKNRGIDTEYLAKSIKFNHRAYAEITTEDSNISWFPKGNEDYSSLINKNYPEFTLEFAYWVGDVPEESVIFSMGSWDPDDPDSAAKGIVIMPTEYIIRIGSRECRGSLQKNSFVDLCIVFENVGTSGKILKVFKNGVYDNVVSLTESYPTGLGGVNSLLIGCNPNLDAEDEEDRTKNHLNVQLYSVRLFNAAFKVGQVVCSYINNVVCNKLVGGAKDPVLLNNLLSINQINKDSGGYSEISSIYSFSDNTYNWGFTSSVTSLPPSLVNLKIPLVAIKLDGDSSSLWNWDNFCSVDPDLEEIDGTFYYKTPNSTTGDYLVDSKGVAGHKVKVSIQGTTTREYTIKNLDIVFQDRITFSPKEEWLPESSFTLKADVIDSGHYNNATIGRFVNDCLNLNDGRNSLINSTAFPVMDQLRTLKSNNKIKSSVTTKACIEGFPVLLVLEFPGNDGIKVLGIYSFNLGRNSIYNLGFKIPTEITSVEGLPLLADSQTFPGYFGVPQAFDNSYTALCYEGEQPWNCDLKQTSDKNDCDFIRIAVESSVSNNGEINYKYKSFPKSNIFEYEGKVYYSSGETQTPVLDNSGNYIDWNSTNVIFTKLIPNGYFWSTHDTYTDSKLWKEVYCGWDDSEGSKRGREQLRKLNKDVVTKLDYVKGGIEYGDRSSWPVYKIDENGNRILDTTQTEEITINYPQADAPDHKLSIRNTAFYYVVCLLFGLVDSFGKNLQLKCWINNDDVSNPEYDTIWSPTFYDMDTALGLNNKGIENIPSTVLDFFIQNSPTNECYSIYGLVDNSIVSVYSNKLWGFDGSTSIATQMRIDYTEVTGGKYSAATWSNLRGSLLKNSDLFINKYIQTQISDCSQFLINQDFEVKYLSNTRDREKLHGTRTDFIKTWLKERIYFLDSVFDFISKPTNYLLDKTPYEVPFRNKVTLVHGSSTRTIPIVTKSPVIITTHIDGKGDYYKYIPKNTPTNVIISSVADDAMSDSGTGNLNTTLNNTNLLKNIELNNPLLKLQSISLSSFRVIDDDQEGTPIYSGQEVNSSFFQNYGNFRGLLKYDLSGIDSFEGGDGATGPDTLFKSWDYSWSDDGLETDYYSLEEIDFTGTKFHNSTNLDLTGANPESDIIDVYKNPFKNLISIKVANSNIRSLNIPDNVSLAELDIENSLIGELRLNNQPLLNIDTLKFSGCTALETLNIKSCNKFTSLNLGSTNKSLKELTIDKCKNLKSIKINANYKYIPKINISDCENLQSINLLYCRVNSSTDLNNFPDIRIYGCKKLTSITISYCDYKKIVVDGTSVPTSSISLSLTYLPNLTTFSYYGVNGVVDNVVDLRQVPAFSALTFSNCTSITEIRFRHSEVPVTLPGTYTFSTCNSLTTITGHILIKGDHTFYRCRSLELNNLINTLGSSSTSKYTFSSSNTVTEDSTNNTTTTITTIIKNGNSQSWYPYNANRKLNVIITGNGAKSLCSGVYNESDKRGPILSNNAILYLLGNINDSSTITTTKITSITRIINGEPSTTVTTTNTDSTSTNYTKVTSINGMFYHCSKPESISLLATVNSDLFKKCTSVTDASSLFFSTPISGHSLPSPSRVPILDEDNTVIGWKDEIANDNGIFSPLKNCTTFADWNFTTESSTCDKFLFRRTEAGGNYAFKSFNDFNAKISSGDMEDFLIDCPSIQSISNSFTCSDDSSSYLNFDKNPKIPLGVTSISSSFNIKGTGSELKLDNLFLSGNSNLQEIKNSFVIQRKDGASKVKFYISRGMFNKFPLLTKLTYYYGYDDGTLTSNLYTSTSTPFRGSGLEKLLDFNPASDQYGLSSILNNNNNWVNVDGLLKDCSWNTNIDENIVIELPGKLFTNQTLLSSARSCFEGVKFSKITLNGEGFSLCNNLSDVSYMFSGINSQLTIPNKLFYHGKKETKTEVNIYGINGDVCVKPTENNKFKYWYIKITGKEGDGNSGTMILESSINEIYLNSPAALSEEDLESGLFELRNGNLVFILPNLENLEGNTTYVLTDGTNNPENELLTIELKLSNIEYSYPSGIEDTPSTLPPTSEISINNRFVQLGKIVGETDHESLNFEHTKFEYENYRQTISKMTGCFQGTKNIDYYRHSYSILDLEQNPNYQPYKYVYQSEQWEKRDIIPKYTLDWVYDGDCESFETWKMLPENESYEIATPDDPAFDENVSAVWRSTFVFSTGGIDIISNFMCPPDLLRYSTTNPNIGSLFRDCGYSYPKNITNVDQVGIEGIVGRLCPYLLKPVPKINNFISTFRNCKWLGHYTVTNQSGNTSYVIPEKFFSYITHSGVLNFDYAFSGISFPAGKIGVNLPSSNLKSIDHMFYNCAYLGTSLNNQTQFTSIFSNVRNINYVFAMDSYGNNGTLGQQYVKFVKIFRTAVTGDHVFYNYFGDNTTGESSYVTHENPRTTSSEEGQHNYEYWSNS